MRPKVATAPAPSDPRTRAHHLSRRQYVRFAFYQIAPEWRRLPNETQQAHKQEFFDVITTFERRMLLRPYTLTGSRADTDLLLWQIAETPIIFQQLATAIHRTAIAGFLRMTHSYISQTKRSIYEIRGQEADDRAEQLIIDPSEAKYLFVYPFIKTRAWYQLSQAARQGMMDEHIEVGRKYPSIRLNTTYSFGIDDYEFIVAFETDEPSDFLDLVQELRETTVSMYTLQDTPLFACTNVSLHEALDALGGPALPVAVIAPATAHTWHDVCAVSDFPKNDIHTSFHFGKMIAIFRIDDQYYAINNRCSHARGPLSEGQINHAECSVVCPWHYGKFDLRSGTAIDGVVRTAIETFDIRVDDQAMIQIRICPTIQEHTQ
jgi:chlorite dismutase/nitrite reductase/ring-hydroxylating ferredoxin subunit